MKRSIFKEKEYFQNRVTQLNESIKQRETKIKNHSDPEIAKRVSILICDDYFSLISSKYSNGDDLESLIPILERIINLIALNWDRQSVNFKMGREQKIYDSLFLHHHITMMKTLSLSVLLDLRKEYFEDIKKLLNKLKVRDKLFDLLINYKIPNQKITSEGQSAIGYRKLEKLAFDSAINTSKILRNQVTWYSTINSNYFIWKDRHIMGRSFDGYWNFELAAVAKVYNLISPQLEANIYFPTDMFNNKKEIYQYNYPKGFKLLLSIDHLVSLTGSTRYITSDLNKVRKDLQKHSIKNFNQKVHSINEYIHHLQSEFNYRFNDEDFQIAVNRVNENIRLINNSS